MKTPAGIYWILFAGFLGLASLNCPAQLTSQQLLQRGEDRALFTNDYEGAIADFTSVINSNYNVAEAYTERGFAYSRETNYAQALLDYSNSIRADPTYWKAYSRRALTERKMGNISNCLTDVRKVVDLSKTNTSALFAATITYEALTNWDGAIDCCDRAIKLQPKNATFFLTRATMECAKGEWQDALADMDRYFQLDQSNHTKLDKKTDDEVKSFDYACRGWIKVQLKKYDSAGADASSAIYFYPSNGLAYYTRGWICFLKNDISGARENCERALAYDESSKDDKSRDQGLLSFVTGDYTNAITQWNMAIGLSRRQYAAELMPWVARASELLKVRTDGH